MYLNKAMIIGNLTRDPELKALPSGIKVCNFSLATNRYFKDKDGNKQEAVEYHNIVAFSKLAELSGQYLKKGQNVFIEGRMQTRSWDGTDGQKKYRTEIVADTIQFGNRPGGSPQSGTAPVGESKTDAPSDTPAESGEKIDYPQETINPDDIPF
ncbi:MAG: single-stranded DNA-binding protein [Candidatus Paceibacterota bacterium]|jgi:single-strand DNA-binding protein